MTSRPAIFSSAKFESFRKHPLRVERSDNPDKLQGLQAGVAQAWQLHLALADSRYEAR